MCNLPEFVWCIKHQEMVKLEHGVCVGHAYEVRTDTGIEIDFCEFEDGYAYCSPPPEFFKDQLYNWLEYYEWANWCYDNQPDVDEQLIMDLNAADLLADLEER